MTLATTMRKISHRDVSPRPPTISAADHGSVSERVVDYQDPLDEDEPTDEIVVTTRRAISRVALVAAETASRFQREGVSHDPMSWMMAPRALFAGTTALEACLSLDACMRGILLHGLSLGLDADACEIDALTESDDEVGWIDFQDVDFAADDDGDHDAAAVPSSGTGSVGRGNVGSQHSEDRHGPEIQLPSDGPRGEPRLFTATVVADDGVEIVQAFHASLATDEVEVAGRLYMRMGAAMADAVIVEGFDASAPLVVALVAPALCDTLALVAADPSSPLAAGLDLNVEQRFLN